jgi:hypothetical protein
MTRDNAGAAGLFFWDSGRFYVNFYTQHLSTAWQNRATVRAAMQVDALSVAHTFVDILIHRR